MTIEDYGIVSALGRNREETRRNMLAGTGPGIRRLTGLVGGDTTCFGFVPGWGPARPEGLREGEFRVGALVDLVYGQFSPSVERVKSRFGADRLGVVMGSSNSTMEEFTDNPDRINMNYPAERLAERSGARGPVLTVSTACSSSAKAFASARRLLEGGAADAVLVGGADAYTRTVVEGFHSLEALSPSLCRPCSARRDGITLGEGCAVFLVTAADGPLRVLGVGESSDAYHLTAPHPEGTGAEAAMRAALADAGLGADDVGFVNLHGTGTVYNDSMELKAVRRLFGRTVCACSTKPLTGHCLGAAGAVEAALTAIALEGRGGIALSNSFAFGGSNASVLLARKI